MDVNAEISAMKRQIIDLKGEAATARAEARAVGIAFSVLTSEMKLRDPQMLEEFKRALLKHMGPLQSGGNIELLRALSEIYRMA